MSINVWLRSFRHSSPYINAHRGSRMVLTLSGEALAHDNFTNIIHDIALLNSLGVKLVLVFGARPQIQSRIESAGLQSRFYEGLRVTEETHLPLVLEAVGALRAQIEASLSMALLDSPMHGSRIRIVGGNLVTAQPVGVRQGVDLCYTGQVRRVDVEALESLLNLGTIVLLPPVGYSPTGDAFNLSYENVGSEVASALKAEKLVMFTSGTTLQDAEGQALRQLSVGVARDLLRRAALHADDARLLAAAAEACSKGVRRAHVISYAADGALLEELFTRDGNGTMVNSDLYEQVRPAQVEDIAGIMELIQPLEEQGILLRRTPELLENEIHRFIVVERDGAILGCAALYHYPTDGVGELACFAVSNRYRRGGRGDQLLRFIENMAVAEGMTHLVVLTTQAEHWFRERGFAPASPEQLPADRRQNYNQARNSKVFLKALPKTAR